MKEAIVILVIVMCLYTGYAAYVISSLEPTYTELDTRKLTEGFGLGPVDDWDVSSVISVEDVFKGVSWTTLLNSPWYKSKLRGRYEGFDNDWTDILLIDGEEVELYCGRIPQINCTIRKNRPG